MTNMLHLSFLDQSVLSFPPEWIRSALVLALITVWMVIVLFTYMNHSTRRTHLSLWTVAWMFYSVYLAASIGLEESPAHAISADDVPGVYRHQCGVHVLGQFSTLGSEARPDANSRSRQC